MRFGRKKPVDLRESIRRIYADEDGADLRGFMLLSFWDGPPATRTRLILERPVDVGEMVTILREHADRLEREGLG